MSDMIQILIADDHSIVRKGLRTLIASEPEMQVVGEACDGYEAVAMALDLAPDVILMDMVMPRKTGLEAIQEIKKQDPAARILVLTSFVEEEQIFPAIKAGALGYQFKDASPDDLLGAIDAVRRGEPALDPSIALKLMQELNRPPDLPKTESPLTEREMEVLRFVARGMTNQEIADQLFVSERTVANHVAAILRKLHLANRTQAALYALKVGVSELDD